jgi:rhamnosyltransferase
MLIEGRCMGFVLHNPSRTFFNRLNWLTKLGVRIYIFDNSDNPNILNNKEAVTYIPSKSNKGLAYAFNKICKLSFSHGYKEILIFDQDTGFTKETIDYIFNYSSDYKWKEVSSITFNNKKSKNMGNQECLQKKTLVVGSGILYNLKALSDIGWYDPSYFVDCVDYEYCLSSKLKGYKVYEYQCTPGYDHIKYQDADLISIFGKKFSLLRVYSLSRVKDTLKSSSKLILKSIQHVEFLFLFHIVRFLLIYVFFQFLARFLAIIYSKK